MRLDKYLCDHTNLTRSLATKAIRAGRIRLNQVKAKSGSQKIQPSDEIQLDGQVVQALPEFRYFMLHKPKGFVCANEDSEHRLVFDLMTQETNVQKLHTVGRLDKDTTGLLFITDDGQWSHFITSPKHHQTKTYRVWLAEPLIESAEESVKQGIVLKDDAQPTLPGELKRISDIEVLLSINEGRYHQVKRMMAALGNRVVELHREQIGEVSLDTNLKEGEFRSLTSQEIESLKK